MIYTSVGIAWWSDFLLGRDQGSVIDNNFSEQGKLGRAPHNLHPKKIRGLFFSGYGTQSKKYMACVASKSNKMLAMCGITQIFNENVYFMKMYPYVSGIRSERNGE